MHIIKKLLLVQAVIVVFVRFAEQFLSFFTCGPLPRQKIQHERMPWPPWHNKANYCRILQGINETLGLCLFPDVQWNFQLWPNLYITMDFEEFPSPFHSRSCSDILNSYVELPQPVTMFTPSTRHSFFQAHYFSTIPSSKSTIFPIDVQFWRSILASLNFKNVHLLRLQLFPRNHCTSPKHDCDGRWTPWTWTTQDSGRAEHIYANNGQ